jgi:hypothetical protein
MTTKKLSPVKAYSVFGLDGRGWWYHIDDVAARSAHDAVLDVKRNAMLHDNRMCRWRADRIHLADIDDADRRALMCEWMDRNGVESR